MRAEFHAEQDDELVLMLAAVDAASSAKAMLTGLGWERATHLAHLLLEQVLHDANERHRQRPTSIHDIRSSARHHGPQDRSH
jgi:hypothetical protein